MVGWLAARPWPLRALAASGAGVLAALGFQPFGWWPLVPLGVAGMSLVVLAAKRVRGATGLGFAWGLGFLGVGIGWMQELFVQAMFGLVAVEACFFALLGAGIKVAARTQWWPLLAAGCWSGAEFAYLRFPFNGFGWMRVGYAMIDSPLAPVLPVIGVAGLSFLTALLAQGIAWLISLLRPAKSPARKAVRKVSALARPLLIACAGIALMALLVVGGNLVPVGTQTGTVKVGWVQGGAPGGGVYGIGSARTTTRSHLAEVTKLQGRIAAGELPRPDFVVLPENTTDLDPYTDAETGALVRAMSQRLGVPMVFGVILDGPGAKERQTATLWWDPATGETARYIKRGIVPFGEFVPLRSLLMPLIAELAYVGAQSVAGTEPGVIKVTLPDGRKLTLGTLICYDLVYDDFVYDTVIHNGEVIVAQSSNAMYQGTGQIDQQFAITRARAMELRREVLVVTTSGISGLINADGSVAFTGPEHIGASGVVSMATRSGQTPATWLAMPLELFLVVLAALGLGASLRWGRMGPTPTVNGRPK